MDAREIRALRHKLRLTQLAFARWLGVTVVTVSRWENGHTPPRADHGHRLMKLAVKSRLL